MRFLRHSDENGKSPLTTPFAPNRRLLSRFFNHLVTHNIAAERCKRYTHKRALGTVTLLRGRRDPQLRET